MTAGASSDDQFFRRRHIAFASEDEEAYCELLRKKAPNIRFVNDLDYKDREAEAPPGHVANRSVAACKLHVTILFAPSDDWQPHYEKVQTERGPLWSLRYPGRLHGRWRRTRPHAEGGREPPTYKGPRIPPGVGQAWLYFSGQRTDTDGVKLAGELIRLVSRVATNKLLFVRTERQEVPEPVLRGGMLWAGFHAIEWARQSPDRILGWNRAEAHSYGYRPLD